MGPLLEADPIVVTAIVLRFPTVAGAELGDCSSLAALVEGRTFAMERPIALLMTIRLAQAATRSRRVISL